jgi:hypothetical protein
MRRWLLLVEGLALVAVAAGVASYDVRRAKADDVIIVFQAMDGAVEAPMVVKKGTKYDKKPGKASKNSGKGWCEIPAHTNGDDKSDGEKPGKVTFKVNVPQAGEYFVWGRTLWPNGCGNSFWVRVGDTHQLLGKDATYDVWKWRRCAERFVLKQGVNVISFINRQDGVLLDEVEVTNSEVEPQGPTPATDGALQS